MGPSDRETRRYDCKDKKTIPNSQFADPHFALREFRTHRTPDTEPHRRETSDNQRPDGRGRVPRNFDSAFPARNYLSPLLPKGSAEGIRQAESSVNPRRLAPKTPHGQARAAFSTAQPRPFFFPIFRKAGATVRFGCVADSAGVELCGARQDSGPPRAEAAARAALRRCNVATECAGFSKA